MGPCGNGSGAAVVLAIISRRLSRPNAMPVAPTDPLFFLLAIIAATLLGLSEGRLLRPRPAGRPADVALCAAAAGGRNSRADRAGAGRAHDLDLSARLECLELED